MIYKTSLDRTARIITIGVSMLFAVIIVVQIFLIKIGGIAVPVTITIAFALFYLIAFAFRPINYQVTADKIIIHRPFADVKIDKSQIKSVLLVDREKMSGVVRTFGVGGMFGYYGKFYNSPLGSMTWYATRKDKTVLIEMANNTKYILTPDEPIEFVASFNKLVFETI